MLFQQESVMNFIQNLGLVLVAVVMLSIGVRSAICDLKKKVERSNKLLQEQSDKLSLMVKHLRITNDMLSGAVDNDEHNEVAHSNGHSHNHNHNNNHTPTHEHTPEAIQPDSKVYIGNIDYAVTEKDLEELFAKFGTIDVVNIPVNRHNGRTRGFGFVTFNSVEEAKNSLELNGIDFRGRQLQVSFAKAR